MSHNYSIAEIVQHLEDNSNQQADVQLKINELQTELAGLERDGRKIKEALARELAVYGFIPNKPQGEAVEG